MRVDVRFVDRGCSCRILVHWRRLHAGCVSSPGRSASSVGTCAIAAGLCRTRYSNSCANACVPRSTSACKPSSVRTSGSGGRTKPRWPVERSAEVDRGRQDRRAGSHRHRHGARRQRRRLAEELDLDAVALDVAVAQQAHDVVAAQRGDHLATGARPERARPSCPACGAGRRTSRTARAGRAVRPRPSVRGRGRPASARPTPTRRGAAAPGSRRCPWRARRDVARSPPCACPDRPPMRSDTAGGSSPTSTSRTNRTTSCTARRRRVPRSVGSARRRWRVIMPRRSPLTTLAPKPSAGDSARVAAPGNARAAIAASR